MQFCRDKALRISGPEHVGIMQAGIPALGGSPVDQHIEFLAPHLADYQVSGLVTKGIHTAHLIGAADRREVIKKAEVMAVRAAKRE
jgi:hypothetical protein